MPLMPIAEEFKARVIESFLHSDLQPLLQSEEAMD